MLLGIRYQITIIAKLIAEIEQDLRSVSYKPNTVLISELMPDASTMKYLPKEEKSKLLNFHVY